MVVDKLNLPMIKM